MSSYTVFTTYVLVPTGSTSVYKQAIHCNYIKSVEIETDNLDIQEISLNFPSIDDFRFLNTGVTSGTGYTAHRIYMLVQTGVTVTDIKPNSILWKVYDVTSQITGYAGILTPSGLINTVFKAELLSYSSQTYYTLDYLNYPAISQTDTLCFGSETYFFGNITTKIKAEVYTTNINIDLSLAEFNSSTNKTWDSEEDKIVYISEIGIYDNNTPKNLVAIGKLNDPVAKNSTIARTIVFALDF